MESAFVLINCELNHEESVIKKLKELEEVKYIHGVFGIYDIIIRLDDEKIEDIKDIVSTKIRGIERITSTVTLTVSNIKSSLD